MKCFQELGRLIERRWRERNYDELVFPDLATQALSDMRLYGQVDPWEIICWLNSTTEIPSQQDVPGNFGNPPITLYSGPRFHIDIYYWLDGTTSIHQHAFCGAFQVLLGSSIHSHYSFECKQEINEHFLVGKLRLENVELLEQGRIKQILPGVQYIHSLFHLDRPSATICVRTYHSASGSPQYNYHKPCFAIDPFFKEPLTVKQVQSASLLLGMDHPKVDAMIGELLSQTDFQTAFTILDLARSHLANNRLEKTFGLSTGEERFQALLETARRRHGDLVEMIPLVLEEARRQNNLIHRRNQITSSEHRFFLALLLNVPDRIKVLELVKQRFPAQNPLDTITQWAEELANTKMLGSAEPNVLGIVNFDDDYLFVLRCLFEGLSLEQTKQAFATECAPEQAEALGDKLAELYHSIRHSLIFKSVLLDLPATTPHVAGSGA